MSNLSLVITYHWYDQIRSGLKTSEYREVKPYWDKRLSKQYDTVTFQRAYTSTKMVFKVLSIAKTTKPNDLKLPEVYEIKLGEQIK